MKKKNVLLCYPQNRDWPMERAYGRSALPTGRKRAIPEERPWYSEIDIMEFLGHEPNVLYGTLHYHTFDGEKKSTSGTWKGDVDYSQDFHVYSLEWEPGEIRWFIDGKPIHSTNNGIPHTPHYLIFNTAVGGRGQATRTAPQFSRNITTSITSRLSAERVFRADGMDIRTCPCSTK